MSTWKERNEAYDRPPTRVFMAATFVQSCGHLNCDAMKRIRTAVLTALYEASVKEGINSTWALEMKTKTPKDFDALLARRGMVLPEPAATGVEPQPVVDAVDPGAEPHPNGLRA